MSSMVHGLFHLADNGSDESEKNQVAIPWNQLDWGSRRTEAIHSSLSRCHLRALLDHVSPRETALGPNDVAVPKPQTTNTTAS